MTQLVWTSIHSSKFVQNFQEVGCLALGFSGIGRAERYILFDTLRVYNL